MALTIEQENALLSLLDEPLVTLNELPKSAVIADNDLFLTRQDTLEKAASASVLKDYFASAAMLEKRGTVQLSNAIDSDSEEKAATPKAVKQTYQMAEEKLSKNKNLADLTDKNIAILNLGLVDMLYPVGAPIPWPSEYAPEGYLKCNGAAFDKTKYPMLAKAYPSGALPDLRGEFIRGWDDGRGVDADRVILGYQGDAIRNITGYVYQINDRANETNGAFSIVKRGASAGLIHGVSGCELHFNASNVVPTANENRPRNIAFLYIVRAA
jgi:phage-related tail fiber protein